MVCWNQFALALQSWLCTSFANSALTDVSPEAEVSHGGSIYTRGIGRCHKLGLYPLRELVVKHLPGRHWTQSSHEGLQWPLSIWILDCRQGRDKTGTSTSLASSFKEPSTFDLTKTLFSFEEMPAFAPCCSGWLTLAHLCSGTEQRREQHAFVPVCLFQL